MSSQDTPPELQPIFSFLTAHSRKLYHEGYFLKFHDLDTTGNLTTQRKWAECFCQLVGTVLALWDALALDSAESSVKPIFINIADASLCMIESLENPQPLKNILSLSTAASNRYLFHFHSRDSLLKWTAAIRLSIYEYACLNEAYTGALIAARGKTLNCIGQLIHPTKFKYEDWVRVRFGLGMPWRRCWCVISPAPQIHDKTYSSTLPKLSKKRSSQNPSSTPVPKGFIRFYPSKKAAKKCAPLATISGVYAAYALYPQSKSLIDHSTLLKIEGSIVVHSDPQTFLDGFVFVMPEVHPAVLGLEIMLRFLFPVWDTFLLYGRPHRMIADVMDTRGLMFAMPKSMCYGYLGVSDVVNLILTTPNSKWTRGEWRKQLKLLTSSKLSYTQETGDFHPILDLDSDRTKGAKCVITCEAEADPTVTSATTTITSTSAFTAFAPTKTASIPTPPTDTSTSTNSFSNISTQLPSSLPVTNTDIVSSHTSALTSSQPFANPVHDTSQNNSSRRDTASPTIPLNSSFHPAVLHHRSHSEFSDYRLSYQPNTVPETTRVGSVNLSSAAFPKAMPLPAANSSPSFVAYNPPFHHSSDIEVPFKSTHPVSHHSSILDLRQHFSQQSLQPSHTFSSHSAHSSSLPSFPIVNQPAPPTTTANINTNTTTTTTTSAPLVAAATAAVAVATGAPLPRFRNYGSSRISDVDQSLRLSTLLDEVRAVELSMQSSASVTPPPRFLRSSYTGVPPPSQSDSSLSDGLLLLESQTIDSLSGNNFTPSSIAGPGNTTSTFSTSPSLSSSSAFSPCPSPPSSCHLEKSIIKDLPSLPSTQTCTPNNNSNHDASIDRIPFFSSSSPMPNRHDPAASPPSSSSPASHSLSFTRLFPKLAKRWPAVNDHPDLHKRLPTPPSTPPIIPQIHEPSPSSTNISLPRLRSSPSQNIKIVPPPSIPVSADTATITSNIESLSLHKPANLKFSRSLADLRSSRSITDLHSKLRSEKTRFPTAKPNLVAYGHPVLDKPLPKISHYDNCDSSTSGYTSPCTDGDASVTSSVTSTNLDESDGYEPSPVQGPVPNRQVDRPRAGTLRKVGSATWTRDTYQSTDDRFGRSFAHREGLITKPSSDVTWDNIMTSQYDKRGFHVRNSPSYHLPSPFTRQWGSDIRNEPLGNSELLANGLVRPSTATGGCNYNRMEYGLKRAMPSTSCLSSMAYQSDEPFHYPINHNAIMVAGQAGWLHKSASRPNLRSSPSCNFSTYNSGSPALQQPLDCLGTRPGTAIGGFPYAHRRNLTDPASGSMWSSLSSINYPQYPDSHVNWNWLGSSPEIHPYKPSSPLAYDSVLAARSQKSIHRLPSRYHLQSSSASSSFTDLRRLRNVSSVSNLQMSSQDMNWPSGSSRFDATEGFNDASNLCQMIDERQRGRVAAAVTPVHGRGLVGLIAERQRVREEMRMASNRLFRAKQSSFPARSILPTINGSSIHSSQASVTNIPPPLLNSVTSCQHQAVQGNSNSLNHDRGVPGRLRS